MMMLDSSFVESIISQYQNLHNEDAEDFEETVTVESEPEMELTVVGCRNDANTWGENKYALDGTVRVSVENSGDWEEIKQSLEQVTDTLEDVVDETIGYDGPIIVRSGEDKTDREWSRRMIHESQ